MVLGSLYSKKVIPIVVFEGDGNFEEDVRCSDLLLRCAMEVVLIFHKFTLLLYVNF